jgi:hypothetical protein
MSMKNYLTRGSIGKAALTALLGLGVVSGSACFGGGNAYNPEYTYDGYIGTEHVTFGEEDNGKVNVVEVKTSDGMTKIFYDTNNDLKLDRFEITDGGKTLEYRNIEVQKDSFGKGSIEFDKYLKQITAENNKWGIDRLARK